MKPAGTLWEKRHSFLVHLLNRNDEQCLRNLVRASSDAFSASEALTFCMLGKALTGTFDDGELGFCFDQFSSQMLLQTSSAKNLVDLQAEMNKIELSTKEAKKATVAEN